MDQEPTFGGVSQQPNCKNASLPLSFALGWKLDPSWILQLGNRVQRCNALYVDVSGHGICWSSLCALVSQYVMSHRSLLKRLLRNHIIYRHLRYFLFTNSFQYLYIHFLHCLIISLGLRFTVVCSIYFQKWEYLWNQGGPGLVPRCRKRGHESSSVSVSVRSFWSMFFPHFFCIFGFTLSLFSRVS